MKHVVLFSGGVGSWAAARRVQDSIQNEPDAEFILLFTDTGSEHPDLYRWLPEAAANVGGKLVWLKQDYDGLWDLFNKQNMIANTRADFCSRILKREPARKWVEENCDPDDTIIYIGIDWTEAHRFDRASPHWQPYTLSAPLIEPPYLSKIELLSMIEDEGMVPPAAYRAPLLYAHNNCSGFCIKQGFAGFLKLLRADPETYAYHEEEERKFRERTGKDVSVLRDRRGGVTKPLTLEAFRLRAEEGGEQVSMFEADTSCAECML